MLENSIILLNCQGSAIDLDTWDDPPSVAGVVKLFLEKLPEPLLTHTLYTYFVEASGIQDSAQR